MIRSMTGFGRARGSVGPDTVAELAARSVNHRFLDLTVKVRADWRIDERFLSRLVVDSKAG